MQAGASGNGRLSRNVKGGLAGLVLATLLTVSGQAGTLFWGGGSTDITPPQPLPWNFTNTTLSGTWNTTAKNWATDGAGTLYTNWSNTGTANHAYFGLNTTNWVRGNLASVVLAGDMTLNRLSADFTAMSAYDATYSLTSSSPVTLTLNGQNPTVFVDNQTSFENITLQPNVRLAGASGFTKIGRGDFRIGSDSSGLTGSVTINDPDISAAAQNANDGLVQIQSTGNLRGIARFNVTGNAANGLQVYAPGAGIQNQLGDAAQINLMGGVFLYSGYRGATYSQETIDSIRLDGSGVLDLSTTSGSGGTRSQLILANATSGCDRGTDGKGCLRVTITGTSIAPANAVVDCIVQNGYPTGVVLPWLQSSVGTPMQLDATKTIVPVPTVAAPADLATWTGGSGVKYVVTNGPFANVIPSIAIDSLGICWNPAVATNITIGDANTLTLTQGLLGRGSGGGVNAITLTGGKITSGTSELYVILCDWYGSQLNINSEITGNLSLIIGGNSSITLGGGPGNTYTGTTYVEGCQITLNKTNAGAYAIPGDLVVGRGTIQFGGSSQIVASASVTVRDGGTLNVAQYRQTFLGTVTLEGSGRYILANGGGTYFAKTGTGLAINGGSVIHSSSATGPLNLLTDVSYATNSAGQAVIRMDYGQTVDSQVLTLCNVAGTYTRTFDVGPSTNVTGKAEMEIDMPLVESTGTAGLTKTGGGALAIRRPTYTLSGAITVNGGRLVSGGAWQSVSRQGRLYGTTVAGTYQSYVVTELARTDDLSVGQPVTGYGIPASTLITRIDSPTQIRLSAATTNNGIQTLTFPGRGGMGRACVLTGTAAYGSPVITGLASTAGLAVRQPVINNGYFSGGSFIASIDSSSQITINNNVTHSGTNSIPLTFTGGSAVGTGPVTVNSTGTLLGDGVAGLVTVNSGGTIDPGTTTNQAATMQFGSNLVFMAGSTCQVDIASDTVNDQLQVFGDITLGGTVNPNLLGTYNPSAATWTIATYTGTNTGTMTAPGRYLVTVDNAHKQVVLTKRPSSTGFVFGLY